MRMNLDAEAALAWELAKRCVPGDWELDFAVLISALIHGTRLKDQFPQLASHIPRFPEHRTETPDDVQVNGLLQPLLDGLTTGNRIVTLEVWLSALLQDPFGRRFAEDTGVSPDDLDDTIAFLMGMALARGAASGPPPPWRESGERGEVMEALASLGRMLTAGEPIQKDTVHLDRPVRSLLRALVKRKQRSAMVIGEPGTGKSALVYEFARRLVTGDASIPERLRDHDIFELSPTFLRSNVTLLGQWEEKVGSFLKLLEANPKVILFVDEVHSMFQSGMHARSYFTDANEAFKQAIARGSISLIGCTTIAEYRHYIEPDQALAQRFSLIHMEPTSPAKTKEILRARLCGVEEYYEVGVPAILLDRIVDLTEEYLPGRAQPRKSIQLLDEACAHCVTQDPPRTILTEGMVWKALEDTVGHGLVREETLTESDLFERLRSKIVGQDDTLRAIARAVVSGLGGWAAKRGAPRGVFFFCGPTGVGKTETAVLLSKILGGSRESLVRVDCNTLQGSGSDSSPALHVLLGPPPGYHGYVRGKGGVLSRIRDHPQSIVLFDEIEKADPGVGKLLLQVMDDGRCEDHDGNRLDFRRSFLVFTTNAGAVYRQEQAVGFDKARSTLVEPRTDLELVKSQIRSMGLGEEFLGRVSHYFVFEGLTRDSVHLILESQLRQLERTAEERGFLLEWDDRIVQHLASAWQPRFGVRHLVAILRNRVVEQLSVADAQGELKGVKRIRLEVLATGGAKEYGELTGLALREREGSILMINLA
ncbi:MAG: AAA family ATPase [Gemmatimonadota bacterium]